jgi:hypothetical protein
MEYPVFFFQLLPNFRQTLQREKKVDGSTRSTVPEVSEDKAGLAVGVPGEKRSKVFQIFWRDKLLTGKMRHVFQDESVVCRVTRWVCGKSRPECSRTFAKINTPIRPFAHNFSAQKINHSYSAYKFPD